MYGVIDVLKCVHDHVCGCMAEAFSVVRYLALYGRRCVCVCGLGVCLCPCLAVSVYGNVSVNCALRGCGPTIGTVVAWPCGRSLVRSCVS